MSGRDTGPSSLTVETAQHLVFIPAEVFCACHQSVGSGQRGDPPTMLLLCPVAREPSRHQQITGTHGADRHVWLHHSPWSLNEASLLTREARQAKPPRIKAVAVS